MGLLSSGYWYNVLVNHATVTKFNFQLHSCHICDGVYFSQFKVQGCSDEGICYNGNKMDSKVGRLEFE